jgi:hypothetical protein
MRTVAVTSLLAVLGLVAGAASASPPRSFAAEETGIVGALPVQNRVLRGILRELAPTQIAAVRVVQRTHVRVCAAPPDSLALTIDAPSNIRARWEALLLANLYWDAAAQRNLRRDDLMRFGPGRPYECLERVAVPPGRGVKDLSSLRRALAGVEGEVVELRTVGGGVAVTIEADNPAAFLRDQFRFVTRQVSKLSPEVNFIGLTDASGALVAGVSHVGNHGSAYIPRALYGCGGIVVLGGPLNPPPCPA